MKNYTLLCWFVLLFLLFIASPPSLYAQEGSSKSKIRWGLEGSSFLSYSGYNFRLAGLLKHARHELYAGPKLVLSKSYLPKEGTWGGQIGYRYYWVQEDQWQAFVNADYQQSWYAPYNPLDLEVNGKNQIKEAHLSFGVFRGLGEHWRVGSQIGVGFYLEQNKDLVAQVTRTYSGYSNLVSLFVTYVW